MMFVLAMYRMSLMHLTEKRMGEKEKDELKQQFVSFLESF